jgi:hypothetical protein
VLISEGTVVRKYRYGLVLSFRVYMAAIRKWKQWNKCFEHNEYDFRRARSYENVQQANLSLGILCSSKTGRQKR